MSEALVHFEKKCVRTRGGVFPEPHRNASRDTVQGGQVLTGGPSTLQAFRRGKNGAANCLGEAQGHKSKDKHLMTSVLHYFSWPLGGDWTGSGRSVRGAHGRFAGLSQGEQSGRPPEEVVFLQAY